MMEPQISQIGADLGSATADRTARMGKALRGTHKGAKERKGHKDD